MNKTISLFLTTLFIAFGSSSAFANPDASAVLRNFSSFGSGLYRGGRPEAEVGFQALKDLGIKTVVSLQGGDLNNSVFSPLVIEALEPGETPEWIGYEKSQIENMGMKFINVPMNSLDPMDTVSGNALGKVLRLISDPKNQPVYIHCEHGIDRTGLAVALYRVYFQQWAPQKAHQEMIDQGHGWLRQLLTGDMDSFFWAATVDVD